MLALVATLPASAASIAEYQFLLDGSDALTFAVDSIVSSTLSNRLLRYRISDNAMSKMASTVAPNSNLVGIGTSVWFTTRGAPFSIGRADLTTVSGNPVYFAEASSPYDDMTLGPDNALWAANAQDGRVVRVTQTGETTAFAGDGTSHPRSMTRGNDGDMWFADGINRRITRIHPGNGAFTHYPVPQLSATTIPEQIASAGTAGTGLIWFATQDSFGSVDPASGAVQVVATEGQKPWRLRAAADGTLWMTTGTPYVTQFTPPAGVAKLRAFSDPAAQSAGLHIDASGLVHVSDQWTSLLARVATARDTAADATIVEFHNAQLDHYFVTADPAEAAAIDAGAAGPGWSRTGQTWQAWTGGPIPNASEVCRFYGASGIDPATGSRRGPNSHFYTVEADECATVRRDPGWAHESAGSFWVIRPDGTAATGCPSWTQPVYRAYNNRFMFNDSNHRYAVSHAIYEQMLAAGWSAEGVVMCAPL